MKELKAARLTILTFKVNTKEAVVNVMNFERLWGEIHLCHSSKMSNSIQWNYLPWGLIFFPLSYEIKRNNEAAFKYVFFLQPPLADSKAVEVFHNSCLENLLKFYWGSIPETSHALQARVCNLCIVRTTSKEKQLGVRCVLENAVAIVSFKKTHQ